MGCSGSPEDTTPELEDSYRVQWGPVTIPPGVESVQCVRVRLDNPVPMKIREITNALGDISHHYIVYKDNDTTTGEQPEPYDCSSVENLIDPDTGVPLMITQKASETLSLPEGVAFELEANQMIRLELHYINAGDQPKEVRVTTDLIPMPEDEFEHAADFVFIGNPDIYVPPNSAATLGPTHFPMPWELYDAKLFGITGHQHKWGTNVYVEITDGQTAQPIYDLPDFDWDEPETVYYEPPMPLPEAGGFNFTCEWFNAGDSAVSFGEGVNDEMCFFWAYYYPSRGALTCFHSEQAFDRPVDICCPGHQLCNLVDDFFD